MRGRVKMIKKGKRLRGLLIHTTSHTHAKTGSILLCVYICVCVQPMLHVRFPRASEACIYLYLYICLRMCLGLYIITSINHRMMTDRLPLLSTIILPKCAFMYLCCIYTYSIIRLYLFS